MRRHPNWGVSEDPVGFLGLVVRGQRDHNHPVTEYAIPCASQAGWSLPSASSFKPWRTLALDRSAISST